MTEVREKNGLSLILPRDAGPSSIETRARLIDNRDMKTIFILLMLTLGLSPAMAGGDLCQKAVEAYAQEKKIPFQFEEGSSKMKGALIVDVSGNPKLFRNQKPNANGRNNEGRVTLEVFEHDGHPGKYALTYEDHCESSCTHTVATFDLGFENGSCYVDRALVKDDLNSDWTLWNKDVCEGLKKAESPRAFQEENPDWQTKFNVQVDAKRKHKPLLQVIDAHCARFGKFSMPPTIPQLYTKPAAPASDRLPASEK